MGRKGVMVVESGEEEEDGGGGDGEGRGGGDEADGFLEGVGVAQ